MSLMVNTLAVLLLIPHTMLSQSKWVSVDGNGKLDYKKSLRGDQIPDFSRAGYGGGGVALPNIQRAVQVSPSGGDDTSSIQDAIDKVSALSLVGGVRGAVELTSGTFTCTGTLILKTSGVVLRGSQSHGSPTILLEPGDPHLAINLIGKLVETHVGKLTSAKADYIPFGAKAIEVQDASGFHPGDLVSITKPVTQLWVKSVGMDKLERSGRDEHWIDGSLSVRRRLASVNGNFLVFEVPLMDSYDATLLGQGAVVVSKVLVTGQIMNVGVEFLRVEAPAKSVDLHSPHSIGLNMEDVADGWVRSVEFLYTTEGVAINRGSERITLSRVDVTQHKSVTSPAKPFDFAINGSQILLERCSGTGDQVFYVATEARQQGPVVVLHSVFYGNGHIQPHQRWFTGLLVDNCDVPGGGIDFVNRGTMGTGHGWAIGWAVSWNNAAGEFTMQQAPGTLSWSIGDRGPQRQQSVPGKEGGNGPVLPFAEIESSGRRVKPDSLYLAQLSERLGPAAVKNIGYELDK